MISILLMLLLFNSIYIQGLYRSSMFEWKSNFMYKPNKSNMSTANIDKQYNMLLWWIRFYSIKYLGDYWSKPVITCTTCMASVHSSYFYFTYFYLTHGISSSVIIAYVPYVIALSGLNTLITSIIDNH